MCIEVITECFLCAIRRFQEVSMSGNFPSLPTNLTSDSAKALVCLTLRQIPRRYYSGTPYVGDSFWSVWMLTLPYNLTPPTNHHPVIHRDTQKVVSHWIWLWVGFASGNNSTRYADFLYRTVFSVGWDEIS